jgi:hypothetical protein
VMAAGGRAKVTSIWPKAEFMLEALPKISVEGPGVGSECGDITVRLDDIASAAQSSVVRGGRYSRLGQPRQWDDCRSLVVASIASGENAAVAVGDIQDRRSCGGSRVKKAKG